MKPIGSQVFGSLRRIAGLLCYALAAFMLVVIVMWGVNRIFWHKGYSVLEDVIVLSVMALIATLAALAGYFLKPGSFSLATLIVGLTLTTLAIGAITSYLRMDGF
jgi:hypothetical protein